MEQGLPEIETLIAFGAALLAMQLMPGPDTMLVIGRGIGQGRKTALGTVLGMTLLAGAVQIPLLVFGVAALIGSSDIAFMILRVAGACYLIWLGARLLWTSVGRRADLATSPQASPWTTMCEGAISALSNPAPLLFMFAFLPQFVDPSRHPVWLQLLILGVLQKLSGFVILGGVALASGALGSWLARRPAVIAWQQRLAGTVMVLLGIRLLLGDSRPGR